MRATASAGQARHHPRDELHHRRHRVSGSSASDVNERDVAPHPGRRSASSGRASASTKSAVVARPLEQVLDEREQRLVGPLHVLEHEHDRQPLRHRLEEPPPGREEPLAVAVGDLREPEQVEQRRHHPFAVAGVGDPLANDRLQLRLGRRGRLVLGDAGAHAHHLGQRPERDALAVGEAAAAVPQHLVGEAVGVLLELPGQPRLADAGDPGDRRRGARGRPRWRGTRPSAGAARARGRRTAGRGRRCGRRRAAPPRRAPPATARTGSGLPLSSKLPAGSHTIAASVMRRVASSTSTAPGSAAPWMRDAVFTRSPATMPWPTAPTDHRRLAGRDRRPRARASSPVRSPSAWTASTSSSATRTARSASSSWAARRAPHRHHGVADELLDGAAVALDRARGRRRSSRSGARAPPRGRARPRGRREPDQVGEEHRHDPPLGGRGRRPAAPSAARHRRPQAPQKRSPGSFARAAGRAGDDELGAALARSSGAPPGCRSPQASAAHPAERRATGTRSDLRGAPTGTRALC